MHSIPLVSGAAIRFEGQLTVFDSRREDSPCYQCLYTEGEDADLNCSENGVLAPLVGVVGSLQALEAIKLITGAGQAMVGRLLLLDGLGGETRQLKIKRNPECAACSV
jgi:adenylyltransferase/sulfurtransferase